MRPLVLAHRGAPAGGLENSLGAFRLLAGLGVDGVELDVQVTADDIPMVAHDATVGGRRIEDLRCEEIRELQGDLDPDLRIPTLAEVLQVIPDQFVVNLELKTAKAPFSLVDCVNAAHSRHRVVVTSFDAVPLIALRRRAPEIRTGLVSGVPVADLLTQVRHALADVVSLYWRIATPDVVARMHDNGVGVYVWTVNGRSAAESLVTLGVDALITDEPGEILAVVTERTSSTDAAVG